MASNSETNESNVSDEEIGNSERNRRVVSASDSDSASIHTDDNASPFPIERYNTLAYPPQPASPSTIFEIDTAEYGDDSVDTVIISDEDSEGNVVVDLLRDNEGDTNVVDLLQDTGVGARAVRDENRVIAASVEEDSVQAGGGGAVVQRIKDENGSDDERPAKKAKLNEYEDEEGCVCSICFDNWTTSGDHRLCCLECGHLFGYSCVLRWIKRENKRSCPTCKKKVRSTRDIRCLFAKRLVALDTTELEDTRAQLEFITKEKNRLFAKVQTNVSKEIELQRTIADLRREVRDLRESSRKYRGTELAPGGSNGGANSKRRLGMFLQKSLEINVNGGSRVFAFNRNTHVMTVSMKSNNVVFLGYGIKKINVEGFKSAAYIHLHTKPIRDLSFHNTMDWLLSVSFDNQVKLVDVQNHSVVATFPRDGEIWSCCWDANDANCFFVGEARGVVSKFDVRNTGGPICTLEDNDDYSPVASLASVGEVPGGGGALVCCQLNTCSIRDQNLTKGVRYPVPMDGPFVCASYDPCTQHLLVSGRANKLHYNSRHCVFSWARDEDTGDLTVNNVHSFSGSLTQKFMSRSCQFLYDDSMYVAAHQETYSNVAIWNVKTGRMETTLPASLPVLDICSVDMVGHDKLLATLSEKKVNFFRMETK